MAIQQFQLFHFAGAPRFSKSPPGEMTGFLGKETKYNVISLETQPLR